MFLYKIWESGDDRTMFSIFSRHSQQHRLTPIAYFWALLRSRQVKLNRCLRRLFIWILSNNVGIWPSQARRKFSTHLQAIMWVFTMFSLIRAIKRTSIRSRTTHRKKRHPLFRFDGHFFTFSLEKLLFERSIAFKILEKSKNQLLRLIWGSN